MSSSSVLQKLKIDNLSVNEIIRNLKEIYLRKKTFCELLENKIVLKQFTKLLFHSNAKIAVAVIEIMYAIPSSKHLKYFDRNDVVMEFKRLIIENENETLTVKILSILHKMSGFRLVLYKLHTFGFCSLFLKFTNYHLNRLPAKSVIIEKMFRILVAMFCVSERQRDMLNDGLFSTMVQIVMIYMRTNVQNEQFIKAIIVDFHCMFRKLQCPIGEHANVCEDVLDIFVDLLSVERVHCSEVFSHFCKLSSQKHTQQMKRFVKFYMDDYRKVIANESKGNDGDGDDDENRLDETNLKIVQRFFEHIRFYETDRILDESDIDVLCALVRRSRSLNETILIYKLILAILRGFGDLKRNSRTKLIETTKKSFEFWLDEYLGGNQTDREASNGHECFPMLDFNKKTTVAATRRQAAAAAAAAAVKTIVCDKRLLLRLADELVNVLLVLIGKFHGIIGTCDLEIFPDFLLILLKWIAIFADLTNDIYFKIHKICQKFKSLIFKRKLFFNLNLMESLGFYTIFAKNEKCSNCRMIRELLRMFRIDLPLDWEPSGIATDDLRSFTVFYSIRCWNRTLTAKFCAILAKYRTFDLKRLFLLVTFVGREFCQAAAVRVTVCEDNSQSRSIPMETSDICKLSFTNRPETLEIERNFLIEQLPYYRVLHDGQFETKMIAGQIEIEEFSFEATKLFFELLQAINGSDTTVAALLANQPDDQFEIVLETLQFADFHNKCNLMNILLPFIDRFCSRNISETVPLVYNYAKYSGLTALRSIAIGNFCLSSLTIETKVKIFRELDEYGLANFFMDDMIEFFTNNLPTTER